MPRPRTSIGRFRCSAAHQRPSEAACYDESRAFPTLGRESVAGSPGHVDQATSLGTLMSEHHDTDEVTEILAQITAGDQSGYDRLFPLILDPLRAMAAAQLHNERANHTLQPTALVNEAYLRMVNLDRMTWRDRSHFLMAASTVMRRILVESARSRRRLKRGGDRGRVDLSVVDPAADTPQSGVDVERLDRAIENLAALKPRHAKVVEMRYFGGATHAEIAEALGVAKRTIDNDWKMARVMLREFYEAADADAAGT